MYLSEHERNRRYERVRKAMNQEGIEILHPRLADFKGRRIILWGETYIMTETGPFRLTRTDDTLHTV